MFKIKLASIMSGGKDSVYATYLSILEGHEIKYLITLMPERQDSWMFHWPAVELTKLQAEALGIKQILQKTKGEKEKELEDLKKVLSKIKNEIDGVVSGAVASQYQKSRIDSICQQLNLKSLAPLWHKEPEQLLKKEVESMQVMVTSVSSAGLDRGWLGRILDEKAIDELKKLNASHGLHMAFEGGEAETFVLDSPIFKKKIEIKNYETVWDSKTGSGYIVIKNAELVSKKIG